MPTEPSLGFVLDDTSLLPMGIVALVLSLAAGVLLVRFGPEGLFLGYLRISVWPLVAPFVYLWKSACDLGRYGREGDRELRGTDQYLLGHVYLYILATILSAAFLWVVAVVTAVVFALLPPVGSSKALATAEEAVKAAQAELAEAERHLAEQKSSGSQRLIAEVERKQRDAKGALERSETAFRVSRERIAERGGRNVAVLDDVASQLEQSVGRGSDADDAHREMASAIIRNTDFDSTDKSLLNAWLDAWRARAKARLALAAVSESTAAEQAKELVAEAEERVSAAREKRDAAVAERREKEAARTPRWEKAVHHASFGFVALFAAVWLVGLLAESWALLLRLAADVRAMRTAADRTGTAPARSEAANQGGDLASGGDILGLSAP